MENIAHLYGSTTPRRDLPVQVNQAALLLIDMQRFCAVPGEGYHSHVDPNNIPPEEQYFFSRLKATTVPAIETLLSSFRAAPRGEVIFTYIESLTKDGRDQSLDYKLTGFNVPKGSDGAKILEEVAPLEDEILIPKTSCSVFCSTNIDYVLRNLGVKQLVIAGIVTNQCVESAVRDAADGGYLVTVVEDGCATSSHEDHVQSLKNMRGFSRVKAARDVVNEIEESSR